MEAFKPNNFGKVRANRNYYHFDVVETTLQFLKSSGSLKSKDN